MIDKTFSGCRRESDYQEARAWWEMPYVIYAFSNPRVRSLLERLMGSNVVRVTDRQYMLGLQIRNREDHEQRVRRRIENRELAEVEREKLLILEGRMSMDEAPAELANHPVFKITMLAKRIIEDLRAKAESKKKRKKVKTFNYDLLAGMEEEEEEDTDLKECVEGLETDMEKKRRLVEFEEFMTRGEGTFTDEDYLRIKYMDPLVEELQEMETVDEVYEVADEIVGEITNKSCGRRLARPSVESIKF